MMNVLGSLARGGGQFRQDVLLRQEDQETCFTVGYTSAPPEGATKVLPKYLRTYLRMSGWSVRSLRMKKSYFEIKIAKRSSTDRKSSE